MFVNQTLCDQLELRKFYKKPWGQLIITVNFYAIFRNSMQLHNFYKGK